MVRKISFLVAFFFFLLFISLWLSYGQQEEPSSFTFVQVTDTHLGKRGDEERIEECFDEINRLKPLPHLVIITGDLTDSGSSKQLKRFKELLERLTMPVYVVPGNHDLGGYKSPKKAIERYEAVMGPSNYCFFYGPIHFVGINSVLFNIERPWQKDDLPERLFAWLEDDLERHKAYKTFVFHHIPSFPDYFRGKFRPTWHGPYRRRWREMVMNHKVEAIFTGHFHRDELHYIGRTPVFVCSPISSKFDRQASYRVYEVKTGWLVGYRQQFLSYRKGYHLLPSEALLEGPKIALENVIASVAKQSY